jgi:hypothetical protein
MSSNPLRVILAWRYPTYAQNMSSKAVKGFPLASLRLKSKTHLTRSVGAEIFKNGWPYQETRLAKISARCVEVKPISGLQEKSEGSVLMRITKLIAVSNWSWRGCLTFVRPEMKNLLSFIFYGYMSEPRGQNRPKNADPLPLVLSLTLLSPWIKYERSGQNVSD